MEFGNGSEVTLDPNRSLESRTILLSGGFPNDENIVGREGKEQLGSCHTGIVNFLVGDGSVRAISITMLPRLVAELTVVNDGTAAALP